MTQSKPKLRYTFVEALTLIEADQSLGMNRIEEREEWFLFFPTSKIHLYHKSLTSDYCAPAHIASGDLHDEPWEVRHLDVYWAIPEAKRLGAIDFSEYGK